MAHGTVTVAPGRLPLLGHTLTLARSPLTTLQELRSHGDIVRIDLGRQPVYVVNSPELINRVLVSDVDKFGKGRFFAKARDILGNAVSTVDGVDHGWQRRLVTPYFRREHLRQYAETMHARTKAMTAHWNHDDQVRLDQIMPALTAGIVIRSLMRSEPPQDMAAGIHPWLSVLIAGTMRRIVWTADWFAKLPTPGNRQFNKAKAELRSLIDQIIASHKPSDDNRGDLLSALLAAADNDSRMDRALLYDEILTMLVAGTETVATAVTWLYYELGRNREVRARLEAEVDTVLEGEPVTFDKISELTYTRYAVNESLRLHSPAWFSMRRALLDVELGGVPIPQGSEVLFSSLTVHRDPDIYEAPMSFDPDRWASPPPRKAFLPFGDGRHKCLGSHFAITEMTAIVATISQQWRLRPASAHVVRGVPSTTYRPNALPMTVQLRHPRCPEPGGRVPSSAPAQRPASGRAGEPG